MYFEFTPEEYDFLDVFVVGQISSLIFLERERETSIEFFIKKKQEIFRVP